jgi:hypothetical protein
MIEYVGRWRSLGYQPVPESMGGHLPISQLARLYRLYTQTSLVVQYPACYLSKQWYLKSVGQLASLTAAKREVRDIVKGKETDLSSVSASLYVLSVK